MEVKKYEIPDGANIYLGKKPFIAKVVENIRLTPEDSDNDIRNIIVDISGSGMKYIEGQSIGVVADGLNEKGKPHRNRLYSVASSRTGDDGLSKTVTLCIKRVVYEDPENPGKIVRGLASNYACDLKPGDDITVTGPFGRKFVLPEDDNTDLIMIAAGTGIAPFRAFVHHIYRERKSWKGKVRLFFGARTGMESLYMNRENDDISQYMTHDTFDAFRALSQVDDDHRDKGYVQHKLYENSHEIWDMIKENNFALYICGMKAIKEGVDGVFRELAAEEGKVWDEMRGEYQAQGRWNVEVY